MSKCPNQQCQSENGFEMVSAKIAKTNFSYNLIQCIECETVIGVVDGQYAPEVVQSLANKLKLGQL